ncbi:magnesium transporter CorA family protein [Bacillus massiliglaciei]|uniref:hypothetical protein n=1 Tax=Bacillus massiliglaciei TaxID=1816693 RepID=UPI000A622650|nr:hypothetical protein [Bacillus massiliglaciei]
MSGTGEKLQAQTHDHTVKRAKFQFLFPFMLDDKEDIEKLTGKLRKENFIFFDFKDLDLQQAFYGGDKVSHRKLEKSFMPNIEPLLFPGSQHDKEGIRRFSKKFELECRLTSSQLDTPFFIESTDVFLCPFRIGMVNIRVRLPENISYLDAVSFGDIFRVLEPITEDEEQIEVMAGGETYEEVKKFIFKKLLPPIDAYLEDDPELDPSYFGSLPFFVDERMYVISYINLDSDSYISKMELYRAADLEGHRVDDEKYEGARNQRYIDRYCENIVYDRWADETYIIMSEYHFSCLTKAEGKKEQNLAGRLYGEYFYSVLLFYYYKIILLKLSHDHSQIEIEKGKRSTERLILMITQFTAKYYIPEVNSTASGKEIFSKLKATFLIDELYRDVKETLTFLYQNQNNISGKSMNYLLQILTIFTTISGIFGMNLVIEDWKGKMDWAKMNDYSVFEWIAVLVTTTGVAVSLILGLIFLKDWMVEKKSRKKQIL